MSFERKSGVLLHPTSLPGKAGIGTLGKEAYKFIDWLESAGQSLWQILPL
jgi:4-alpha-glucanotransferase